MHTLEQIQEYNRKTITCLLYNDDDYKRAEYITGGINSVCVPFREYEGENITLSKVLLVLTLQKGMVGYAEGYLIYCQVEAEVKDVLEDAPEGFICRWELHKETLEEQEEETQRVIFKLLGGDSKCKKYPPEEIPTHKGTRDALEDLCNFNTLVRITNITRGVKMKLYAKIMLIIFVIICISFCLVVLVIKYVLLLNPNKLNFESKFFKTRCSINFNKE